MSTPSTATITVPPSHNYYPHSARYLPAMNDYPPNSPYQPAPDQRNRQQFPPPTPTYPPSHAEPRQSNSQTSQYYDAVASNNQSRSAVGSNKRRREEPVDWERYFGGKPPKEIIVIDDDSPAPQQSNNQQQLSHGVPLSRADARPADKKRKTTNPTTYDPVYHAGQYSGTQTPYDDYQSARYTGSTDRTAPYQSTAPTSLGSTSSGGAYAEDASIGQKRKRSTRQAAVDMKRRGLDLRTDQYPEYIPPPKPPIKAKDVHVAVIPDKSATRHQKCDDADGHYLVVEQAELTERYTIMKLLGQGTFGKVVRAYDRHRRKEVAIKIIRSVQKYRDASRIELRVLSTLASNDSENRNKCIHLRDTFDFRNHICIVTDLLGQSVFDFLKANSFVPFPSSHIQNFARQLFTSVAFLHDLNLIHTDLKPENILLVNNGYQTFTYNRNIPSSSHNPGRKANYRKVLLDPEIRLIDFGSATFDDEYHSSVVSTRHYRAPEIILNLGWSFPCDIWSIGCILVEFFTGDALFQTHDNLEHLAMMEAVCDGAIDKTLVRQVCAGRGSNKNTAAAFFKRLVLDYPQQETPKSSKRFVKAMKKLHEIIPGHTTPFNKHFLDLLRKIFVYDPKKRITAKEALHHPWFREHFEDDGTEATKIRIEREKQEAARAGY
ncbi:kinase-like protein [Myriangium duriaei CBS 260.36]|uniref:dual-specificity kinase n=1 Tax=Myriangium duriaei CBS 260.36 TaxID=1168546 RepID=A0A9P4IQW3_9PEZI|nr:kinase-like protein [Myriangium duriaei CBS 260.36]